MDPTAGSGSNTGQFQLDHDPTGDILSGFNANFIFSFFVGYTEPPPMQQNSRQTDGKQNSPKISSQLDCLSLKK